MYIVLDCKREFCRSVRGPGRTVAPSKIIIVVDVLVVVGRAQVINNIENI
jgi:hypothetical protein